MSRQRGDADLQGHRFPRVSGDEPFIIDTVYTNGLFSPRERG